MCCIQGDFKASRWESPGEHRVGRAEEKSFFAAVIIKTPGMNKATQMRVWSKKRRGLECATFRYFMDAEEQKASGTELAARGTGWREDGEGRESFEEKEVGQNCQNSGIIIQGR